MISGILGKKIGMTQIFEQDGTMIPVTVLEAGPCQVQAIKSSEKDGYDAVQLGYSDIREKRVNKPQLDYIKKCNLKPKRFVREIRCKEKPDIKIGDTVTNNIFHKGDILDITGVSKGKGFQGGMKRCHWVGGDASHGSMFHRAPGSIGSSTFPSRVFKGLGMAGHMGAEQVTVQNLEIIDVNTDNNTISVRGCVPGANGSYLVIKCARKMLLGKIKKPKAQEAGAAKAEAKDKGKGKPAKAPKT